MSALLYGEPETEITAQEQTVPNITKVNAALGTDLHPVEVFEWYTQPNPDLFIKEALNKSILD